MSDNKRPQYADAPSGTAPKANLQGLAAIVAGAKFKASQIVQVNPKTQRLIGALNQAKREINEGHFSKGRQATFINFLKEQDWKAHTLAGQTWKELIEMLQNTLLDTALSAQIAAPTRDDEAFHHSVISSMYAILCVEPSLTKYIKTDDATVLEALRLNQLVTSDDDTLATLGVNMTQLLVHHREDLTLVDLVQYDVSARDVIQKRESLKVWEAINSIGSALQRYPNSEQLEHLKALLMPSVEDKIEDELEKYDTTRNKKIQALFDDKLRSVNSAVDSHEKKLTQFGSRLQVQESALSAELQMLKRVIRDFQQGRVTSDEDLKEVGDAQAQIDAAQDALIADIQREMREKNEALQKEMHRLKITSLISKTTFLGQDGAALGRQPSGLSLAQTQTGQLGTASQSYDELISKLDLHWTEINHLKTDVELLLSTTNKPAETSLRQQTEAANSKQLEERLTKAMAELRSEMLRARSEDKDHHAKVLDARFQQLRETAAAEQTVNAHLPQSDLDSHKAELETFVGEKLVGQQNAVNELTELTKAQQSTLTALSESQQALKSALAESSSRLTQIEEDSKTAILQLKRDLLSDREAGVAIIQAQLLEGEKKLAALSEKQDYLQTLVAADTSKIGGLEAQVAAIKASLPENKREEDLNVTGQSLDDLKTQMGLLEARTNEALRQLQSIADDKALASAESRQSAQISIQEIKGQFDSEAATAERVAISQLQGQLTEFYDKLSSDIERVKTQQLQSEKDITERVDKLASSFEVLQGAQNAIQVAAAAPLATEQTVEAECASPVRQSVIMVLDQSADLQNVFEEKVKQRLFELQVKTTSVENELTRLLRQELTRVEIRMAAFEQSLQEQNQSHVNMEAAATENNIKPVMSHERSAEAKEPVIDAPDSTDASQGSQIGLLREQIVSYAASLEKLSEEVASLRKTARDREEAGAAQNKTTIYEGLDARVGELGVETTKIKQLLAQDKKDIATAVDGLRAQVADLREATQTLRTEAQEPLPQVSGAETMSSQIEKVIAEQAAFAVEIEKLKKLVANALQVQQQTSSSESVGADLKATFDARTAEIEASINQRMDEQRKRDEKQEKTMNTLKGEINKIATLAQILLDSEQSEGGDAAKRTTLNSFNSDQIAQLAVRVEALEASEQVTLLAARVGALEGSQDIKQLTARVGALEGSPDIKQLTARVGALEGSQDIKQLAAQVEALQRKNVEEAKVREGLASKDVEAQLENVSQAVRKTMDSVESRLKKLEEETAQLLTVSDDQACKAESFKREIDAKVEHQVLSLRKEIESQSRSLQQEHQQSEEEYQSKVKALLSDLQLKFASQLSAVSMETQSLIEARAAKSDENSGMIKETLTSAIAANLANTTSQFESMSKRLLDQLTRLEKKLDTEVSKAEAALKKSQAEAVQQLEDTLNEELYSVSEEVEKLNATLAGEVKKLNETVSAAIQKQSETLASEVQGLRESTELRLLGQSTTVNSEIASLKTQVSEELARVKDDFAKQEAGLAEQLEQKFSDCASDIEKLNVEITAKSGALTEKTEKLGKKIQALHQRLKSDLSDVLGKLKADLGLLQTDHKVNFDKIVQIERFMDRLRASNTYGEPIVKFNEDSVSKTELKSVVQEEQRKIVQRIKQLTRRTSETEPVLKDVKEDVAFLKELYKKSQLKMSTLEASELSGMVRITGARSPSPKVDNYFPQENFKRILSLIENNQQALSMQRETFHNIMVRVQLLEKAQRTQMRELFASRSPSQSHALEIPTPIKQKNFSTLDKAGESTDISLNKAQDQMRRESVVGRREVKSLPRGSFLPATINLKRGGSDSDFALFDNILGQSQKRSQMRANHYGYANQTPNSSLDQNLMSPYRKVRRNTVNQGVKTTVLRLQEPN